MANLCGKLCGVTLAAAAACLVMGAGAPQCVADAAATYAYSAAPGQIPEALEQLLTFHPGWVTRSVTSHDPWGGNGDGGGYGLTNEGDYRVLFHGRGEGRILRIWMTANIDQEVPNDYQELWIQVDGQTVFRGKPLDFFQGRGPWKSPLVLDYQPASGSFLSYVPFAYSHEAKVLFLGNPHYYQVTYREGEGSSAGPTSAELEQLLSESWWQNLPAFGAAAPVSSGHSLTLATGPATISQLALQLPAGSFAGLSVRVGSQPPVPAAFFFGLGSTGAEASDGHGWADVHSAIHYASPSARVLATRLPIPLQAGETLSLVASGSQPVAVRAALRTAPAARSGARLVAQFKDQWAPGTDTTMAFLETSGATQMVAHIEEITDGAPGSREYLEGDEMIRTDRLSYPFQLGTGTEDYFNGGWYFLGAFSNPMSGQPRFIVNDPDDGWSHARFEHSLYREHILDPIVGRDGMRFGMEAGDVGAYTPAHYRTLDLAYVFDGFKQVAQAKVPLNLVSDDSVQAEADLSTAVDAEHAQQAQQAQSFHVRSVRGHSSFRISCPGQDYDGVLLSRSYDAAQSGQHAVVRVGGPSGRVAGELYEAYANPYRRFAQDALWVDLQPSDCVDGVLSFDLDSSDSGNPWTEIEYHADFYQSGDRVPSLTQGPAVRVFDSKDLPGGPYYVNDHTWIQGLDGKWHIYGIFHQDPFGPDDEHEFVHALQVKDSPLEQDAFSYDGIALTMDASLGETHIWAPHVVRDGDRWVMVYHGGFTDNDKAQIWLAQSTDLTHWTRVMQQPLFVDICVARDPMLQKLGDLWTLYYTRCDSTTSHESGVAYRTSSDLIHWSDPSMALVLSQSPPMFNSGYTESPFVFEKDGWYYLTVTSYPVVWNATFMFRSRSPFSFPSHSIQQLTAHAAEWIRDDKGGLWMSSAGPGQGGVYVSPITGF